MKKTLVLLSAVGLVGLAAVAANAVVLDDVDDEKGEQEISVKELPKSIRRALKDLKIGQVAEVERSGRGEKAVYEVELRVGKHEVELALKADGKLVGVEIEQGDDEEDDGKGDDDDDDDDDDD
jgi:hypothetical protein